MGTSSNEEARAAREMLESNPLYDVALMTVTPWVNEAVLRGPHGEIFVEMLVFAFLKGADCRAKLQAKYEESES